MKDITLEDNSENDHFQEVVTFGLHIKKNYNLTIVAVDIVIMPAFEATAALIAIEWDIFRETVEPQNSSIYNHAVLETEDAVGTKILYLQ